MVSEQAGITSKQYRSFWQKILPETMVTARAFSITTTMVADILIINSMDWPGHATGKSLPALYHNNGDGTSPT